MIKKIVKAITNFFNISRKRRVPVYQPRHIDDSHSSHYTFKKNEISFIHIPRTGGTTLHHILEKNAASLFINLHIHRPVSLFCLPGEFKYVTFLREPVARVISFYNMAKHESSQYYHYASRGLKEFISNSWEARNMACRYLSGHINQEIDENLFMMAKENLRSFYFIGLFEQYEIDVRNLLLKININPNTVSIPTMNPSILQDVTAETDLIQHYNKFDIMLYDWFVATRTNPEIH